MSASRIAPQSMRPGSSRWPGFRRKKCARARLDRDAANLAAFPVDAGGDVNRNHAPAGAGENIDALDDRFRRPIDVAREPGPEQGVDDASGPPGSMAAASKTWPS